MLKMKTKFLLVFLLGLTFCVKAQLTPTYDNILIPMRDGKFLSADVFIPSGTTTAQVVLIQTPYNKNLFSWSLPLGTGQNLDSQPYIFVIVDWRGFYGSAGAMVAGANRGEDGYDVCEWISQQSWFGGRIGTWGPSALGKIQYDTAREQHPNHTCAVPMVAHPHFSYDTYYTGGVLEKARLDQLDALGYGLSPIVLANPYMSNTWTIAANQTWFPTEIAIPTLQIGGWYDHNIDKMLDWYEDCRNQAALAVRDKQWLLVGPWVHGGSGTANPGSANQGELIYPNVSSRIDSTIKKFFEFYLLDSVNNWESSSKITHYEIGTNQWRTSNATRIESTTNNELFLADNGSLAGQTGATFTSFVCDPSNPSPTIGGANLSSDLDQGPYDQATLIGRSDVISFASPELPIAIHTLGNVKLNLFVESNQPDGDICVRLVDVYPDGRNMLITDGIKRIRFRNGYTQAQETFMTAGTVYPLEVELAVTNYVWQAGHKIKVFISGNSFSRWDVNLQNGGTMYSAGDTNSANIKIHHSAMYPSKISLPGAPQSLSVASVPNDIQFIVYPNPAQSIVRIETDIEVINYQLFDSNGKLMMETKSAILSVENLVSGSYILKAIGKDVVITRSIQIIR